MIEGVNKMQIYNYLKRLLFVFGVFAFSFSFNPTSLKAQDIVAILSCPMGCGVMEDFNRYPASPKEAREILNLN